MNDLSLLKVDELKDLLKDRGLSLKGKKDDMIKRLKQYNHDHINNMNTTTNDNDDTNNHDHINNMNTTTNENDDTNNTNNNNTTTINNNDTINNDDTLMNEDNNNDNHITNNDNNDSTITCTSNVTTTTTTTTAAITSSSSSTKLDLERSLRERLLAKTKLIQQAKQTKNVRIDNFQRPFTLKQLQEFLELLLSMKIDDQNIWLNSIKTHCYLTFDTEVDAMNCINKIKGQRFPSTSPTELAADYTKVSVQEAPTSIEADTIPSEWKKLTKEMKNTIKRTRYKPSLLYETVDEATVKKRREEKE